jgi:hypothetical protein
MKKKRTIWSWLIPQRWTVVEELAALRVELARLKLELADERQLRTTSDQANNRRFGALEKSMDDVADGVEALTEVTSDDETKRTLGWFHMMKRELKKE